MKVKVWGVKNLKLTERKEYDQEKGEYVKIPEKRCTGTIEFPVGAIEAGIFEDRDCEITLSCDKNPTLTSLNEKMDGIMDLTLALAKEVQEMRISEIEPMPVIEGE